jgi:hypothetical protein
MNWMNWLPTLQGFLFGVATFFALFCLMDRNAGWETERDSLWSALFAAVAVAYAASIH